MTIDFNLVALLDFLAFVQGTLLGTLLMVKKKEHLSYFLLGLFLFTYSSELLVSILEDTNIFPQKPEWIYLPITFYFWFMPALFLYVKSLRQAIDWKKYSWIFLPGLIEIITIWGLFLQPVNLKLEQLHNDWTSLFYSIYIGIAMLYTIGYAIAILQSVRNHQRQVRDYYSNAQGKLLDWVKWICLIIILINLFLLSAFFLEEKIFSTYLYPTVSAFNVCFIFWIALSGFSQKVVVLPKLEVQASESSITVLKKIEKEETDEEFEKVLIHLQQEKSYRQADLRLPDLSNQLYLSSRHLSELIKHNAGVNFNQFINHLRVEEAKRLLLDKEYAHLNILGIGQEVGFNSKSAFYTAFKKEVGLTPAKYQKQVRNPVKKS